MALNAPGHADNRALCGWSEKSASHQRSSRARMPDGIDEGAEGAGRMSSVRSQVNVTSPDRAARISTCTRSRTPHFMMIAPR